MMDKVFIFMIYHCYLYYINSKSFPELNKSFPQLPSYVLESATACIYHEFRPCSTELLQTVALILSNTLAYPPGAAQSIRVSKYTHWMIIEMLNLQVTEHSFDPICPEAIWSKGLRVL